MPSAESDAGEQPGGRDITADEDGCWRLLKTAMRAGGEEKNERAGDPSELTVSAAPVHHSVPTVGYVVAETDKKGRLIPDATVDGVALNEVKNTSSLSLPKCRAPTFAICPKCMRTRSKHIFSVSP